MRKDVNHKQTSTKLFNSLLLKLCSELGKTKEKYPKVIMEETFLCDSFILLIIKCLVGVLLL